MSGGNLPPIPTLQERVKRLPDRRRASERVGKLKQYQDLTAGAARAVREVRCVRGYLQDVFPGAKAAGSQRVLEGTRGKACTLLRLFTSPDVLDGVALERGIGELRRAVQSATSTAQEEWARQIGGVAERYERLVAALQRTAIAGSSRLVASVERIKRASKPPSTAGEAEAVRQDIAAVAEAIKGLGLEGSVGDFLTAVADRRGDARMLLRPEVSAFLDKHELWDLLTVSFR